MNDTNNNEKPPITASYIAHITVIKLQDQLEFSKKKLIERLGEATNQDEIDEGIIAQQFLSKVDTLVQSLSRNTKQLRKYGPLTPEKLKDFEKVKELSETLKSKSIALSEEI